MDDDIYKRDEQARRKHARIRSGVYAQLQERKMLLRSCRYSPAFLKAATQIDNEKNFLRKKGIIGSQQFLEEFKKQRSMSLQSRPLTEQEEEQLKENARKDNSFSSFASTSISYTSNIDLTAKEQFNIGGSLPANVNPHVPLHKTNAIPADTTLARFSLAAKSDEKDNRMSLNFLDKSFSMQQPLSSSTPKTSAQSGLLTKSLFGPSASTSTDSGKFSLIGDKSDEATLKADVSTPISKTGSLFNGNASGLGVKVPQFAAPTTTAEDTTPKVAATESLLGAFNFGPTVKNPSVSTPTVKTEVAQFDATSNPKLFGGFNVASLSKSPQKTEAAKVEPISSNATPAPSSFGGFNTGSAFMFNQPPPTVVPDAPKRNNTQSMAAPTPSSFGGFNTGSTFKFNQPPRPVVPGAPQPEDTQTKTAPAPSSFGGFNIGSTFKFNHPSPAVVPDPLKKGDLQTKAAPPASSFGGFNAGSSFKFNQPATTPDVATPVFITNVAPAETEDLFSGFNICSPEKRTEVAAFSTGVTTTGNKRSTSKEPDFFEPTSAVSKPMSTASSFLHNTQTAATTNSSFGSNVASTIGSPASSMFSSPITQLSNQRAYVRPGPSVSPSLAAPKTATTPTLKMKAVKWFEVMARQYTKFKEQYEAFQKDTGPSSQKLKMLMKANMNNLIDVTLQLYESKKDENIALANFHIFLTKVAKCEKLQDSVDSGVEYLVDVRNPGQKAYFMDIFTKRIFSMVQSDERLVDSALLMHQLISRFIPDFALYFRAYVVVHSYLLQPSSYMFAKVLKKRMKRESNPVIFLTHCSQEKPVVKLFCLIEKEIPIQRIELGQDPKEVVNLCGQSLIWELCLAYGKLPQVPIASMTTMLIILSKTSDKFTDPSNPHIKEFSTLLITRFNECVNEDVSAALDEITNELGMPHLREVLENCHSSVRENVRKHLQNAIKPN